MFVQVMTIVPGLLQYFLYLDDFIVYTILWFLLQMQSRLFLYLHFSWVTRSSFYKKAMDKIKWKAGLYPHSTGRAFLLRPFLCTKDLPVQKRREKEKEKKIKYHSFCASLKIRFFHGFDFVLFFYHYFCEDLIL